MKIVNRKEFLSLSNGVLYSHYESLGMIDGLSVKTGTYENDWVYEDIISDIDIGDEEFIDYVSRVEDENQSFKMDLECGRRDGLYEKDQLFVIYDKEDLEKLITKLSSINDNYNRLYKGMI